MKRNEYVSALCAALAGLGAGMALLLLGALPALRTADPKGMLAAVAYGALIAGSGVCGVWQGRVGASLSMLALAAGSYGGILLLVSLIFGGAGGMWMKLAVYLLMSLIAILVGRLTPSARPKRKYRYK